VNQATLSSSSRPVSGAELVAVLKKAGFRQAGPPGAFATLARRHDVVVVPQVADLSPVLVAALLRSAKLEPAAIVANDG